MKKPIIKNYVFTVLLILSGLFCSPQSDQRIKILSATPSINTGQSYNAWLNDDMSNLISNVWSSSNFQYIDVTLQLESKSKLTRLSFYDSEGIFTENPVSIYAANGNQRIFLGLFTGESYMAWIDLVIQNPVVADAIIIHKWGNNVPQKIKVFGHPETAVVPPVIFSLPGLVQAENYEAMNGVQTETTSDSGNGLNVGWIDNDDWMDYKLSVSTTGNYAINFRVASINNIGEIEVQNENGAVLASATVHNTGGWQNWATIKKVITLSAGVQKLRIYAKKGGWNINWFEAVKEDTILSVISGKMLLDPKRWYQLNNTSNGLEGLFDENTNTNVHTGWGHILYNFDAYYPLLDGEEIKIERIKMFDGEGSNIEAPLTLSVITDNWQTIPIATFIGDQYMKWVGPYPGRRAEGEDQFKLDVPLTNVKYIVLNTSYAYPTEIEFYGEYKMVPSAMVTTRKNVQLKQTFGINAFEWDFEEPNNPSEVNEAKMKAVKSFTGVRHYMDWEKLEMQEGKYTYNPTHSGGWNYDAIYERCKMEGIEVLACLKTIPKWIENTYPAHQRDYENVPIKYGMDFSDPRSYTEQAKVAFQYAARYGSNQHVNPALVNVNPNPRWGGDPVNVVKIGLNLIKYIECDNERDKWWKGRKAYQTGREYAANLSAFYDGHKNTMGAGVGVKNADPAMKVVMAGLASATTDYVRGMIDWCKQFRGYKEDGTVNLCWDIINYHLYSNDASSSQGGNATRGAAPEVSEAGAVAANFIQMAAQYANEMPVWVTECGYDVNQGSPLKAIAIGNKSVLETQADWILRTALLYARSGIEKVFFYQLYDANLASGGVFNSSGLINADKTRKPASDYLYQVNKYFGEFAYKETISNDPIADRYEFNGQVAYMLVVPDEKGRKVNYTLDLGTADSAYVYQPLIASDVMDVRKYKISGGKIIITVTETPVFVVAVGLNTNNRINVQGEKNTMSMTNPPDVSNSNIIHSSKPGAIIFVSNNKNVASEKSISIYPNPASNYINIVFQNEKKKNVEVRIIEAGSGKVYGTYKFTKGINYFIKKVDISFLQTGFYLLEIRQGGKKSIHKFVKNRD